MRAYINAARRLVEDQELRFGQQPAREENLLLVTAGEKFNGLFRAQGADAELAYKALGNGVLFFTRNGTQPPALRL